MTRPYTDQTRRTTKATKAHAVSLFHSTANPETDGDEEDEGDDDEGVSLAERAGMLGAVVYAGQMLMGNLTSADLSSQLGVKPPLVNPSITQRESGIAKDEVYQRPYRVAAQALSRGATREEAMAMGTRRLNSLVGVDLQMAKVREGQQVLRSAKRKTYQRETTSDNPCDLCEIASTQVYYTEDLMPIHDGCSCEITEDTTDGDQEEADKDFEAPEPDGEQQGEIGKLNEDGADPQAYRDLVAVREHGEIGPVLTWENQAFTGPENLPRTPVVTTADSRVLTDRHGRPLSAQEANARNAADREGYRRRADEKRKISGAPEPRYALGTNPESPYARTEYPEVWQSSAKLEHEHPGLRVEFRGNLDPESAFNVTRAMDDLLTKYPHAEVREINSPIVWSGGNAYATTMAGQSTHATETDISLNADHFDRHRGLKVDFDDSVSAGFHNPYDGKTPEYAITTHEFGHALDATGSYRASRQARQELVDLYLRTFPDADTTKAVFDKEFSAWMKKEFSGYSFAGVVEDLKMLNPTEALAEAFAHVELEPASARPAEKMLHDLVVRNSYLPKERMYTAKWVTAATEVMEAPAEKVATLEAERAVEAGSKVRRHADEESASRRWTPRHVMTHEEAQGRIVLNQQHMVDNILDRYNDSLVGENAWIGRAGAQWYPEARRWVDWLLADSGRQWTENQAIAAVAAFSGNAQWPRNMIDAENFFRGRPVKALGNNIRAAERAVSRDDPIFSLRGPKWMNFAGAIHGDPDAVAIDRWAARAALGSDDWRFRNPKGYHETAGLVVSKRYDELAEAYREAARQASAAAGHYISPAEVQATVWVHIIPPDADLAAFRELGHYSWLPEGDLKAHIVTRTEVDQSIYDAAKAKHGITIDLEGNRPVEGYAYAPSKDTERKFALDALTPEDIDRFIDDNYAELSRAGNHVGLWADEKDFYLDVSRVGPASAETIAKAQAADQLGVYDLAAATPELGNIDTGSVVNGRYTKNGEAADLHTQHQEQIQRPVESRSAPGISEIPGRTEEPAAAPDVAPRPAPAKVTWEGPPVRHPSYGGDLQDIVDLQWASKRTYDTSKDAMRAGAREAQVNGYEQQPESVTRHNYLNRFRGGPIPPEVTDEMNRTYGKELVARAIAGKPSTRIMYRGMQLTQAELDQLSSATTISMPLSSFTVTRDEALRFASHSGDSWFKSEAVPADATTGAVLKLEKGAKLGQVLHGQEWVGFGQFDIVDVKPPRPSTTRKGPIPKYDWDTHERNMMPAEITIRQRSMIEHQ